MTLGPAIDDDEPPPTYDDVDGPGNDDDSDMTAPLPVSEHRVVPVLDKDVHDSEPVVIFSAYEQLGETKRSPHVQCLLL